MAEEHHHHHHHHHYHDGKSHESETPITTEEVETKDRGLFDFLGKKKEEKSQEEVLVAEFEEKVQVSEAEGKMEEPPKEEEKKPSFSEKLPRSGSSSSLSVSLLLIYIYMYICIAKIYFIICYEA